MQWWAGSVLLDRLKRDMNFSPFPVRAKLPPRCLLAVFMWTCQQVMVMCQVQVSFVFQSGCVASDHIVSLFWHETNGDMFLILPNPTCMYTHKNKVLTCDTWKILHTSFSVLLPLDALHRHPLVANEKPCMIVLLLTNSSIIFCLFSFFVQVSSSTLVS